jgi:peptide-methionine (R)-S-oxide reductase
MSDKSDKEWKDKLTQEQYQVCWLKSTERPFTGEYLHNKEQGTYSCICCGNALFSSQDKYDSGSGWPSYIRPISSSSIREIPDSSHGMERVEIVCGQCGAHLGHVFSDGPAPTHLRYCINSAALRFDSEK